MSVETKPNRLTKGLVLDTFHTDVDNTVATYALNSQLEDQEGNHFHYGSEVGTTYIKEIPENHVVIGHINMERNETVLFTTDGTNSTIGILSRKDDMSYEYEIKVDDTKQTKKLGFKKEGYVRGVYRLLNGCDKVIYFVDGINKDRRININQLDSYKLPDTQSVASGIIFDDSLRATIYALSSATGNIQLIRLLSASPEATANVLANLTSGESLTKLLTASANGIGTAFANLMRTANIISSVEATGTTTSNVDIIRLLQGNVTAIGSVNATLESITQGLVEIEVSLTGVASTTAALLRAALLESSLTTEASTVVEAILTRVINAQVQASADTSSSAQITIPVNASATATAVTAADALLSYAVNATVNAMADTSATAQLSKVITASADALASSSAEALIGLVLISTTSATGSVSSANLFISRLLTSSVTAQGTTTAEALIAKLLQSSVTAQATTTSNAVVSKLTSSSVTAQASVTANSLVSKLLASTVNGIGSVTANLQLADLLSLTVTGTATTEALLEAISSMFSINRGLRFSSSRSTYLSRTPTVAGNRTTWTYSTWIKRGNLSNEQYIIFGANGIGGINSNSLRINADRLIFEMYNGSGQDYALVTTSLFRDISSWYHIVAVWDTTNAIELDRIRLYVNGIRITSFTSGNTLVQNTNSIVNSTTVHYIGGNTTYFDGYMAEVNFIDGQALTPTSFGELSTTTGTWIPKAYTGTYGTNGFNLKFSDIALTTSSNSGLGKDFANSNYWATTNFSVTSGSTYDAMTDSPTNTSETIGNYATLNPLNNSSSLTLSNGNLDSNRATNSWASIRSTFGITSGKWYWEIIPTSVSVGNNFQIMIGISLASASSSAFYQSIDGYGYYFNGGTKWNNNTGVAYGDSYGNNDVIGVAFDADSGKLWFAKNNIWQVLGDPVTGVNAAFSSLASNTYFPTHGHYGTSSSVANFGQRPFEYTPPTGFKALNTSNLPTPTIGATAATQANKFMDISLYTGTGAAQSIFNSGAFQPDLVWIKNRTGTASNHALYDSVRGVTKQLSSNTTTAETTETTGLTAFNSNGFTIGALAQINTSGSNYIAWQWKASDTTIANTVGTIASTVSVNTTAGFSIVRYTGTGSNATVGHGLGVAPKMIIIKGRGASGAAWIVINTSVGSSGTFLYLHSNVGLQTVPTVLNSTYPTNSVFSIGTSGYTNASTEGYVAYCWAEIDGFSKFNSYVGNGNSDGTFIYTGFRPKFILIKASSTTGNWAMYNSIVDTSNPVNDELLANSSANENTVTLNDIDFLSNGFKLRGTDSNINTLDTTYIYGAFAEFPLKYANAALTERVKETVTVDYLVVAGGGGGGGISVGNAGGGGAGGYLSGTVTNKLKNTNILVTIGGAGAVGTSSNVGSSGGNSVFDNITADGGGGGGVFVTSAPAKNPVSGGSGGGCAQYDGFSTSTGASGISGEGNKGGNRVPTTAISGAGGGGAGAAGGNTSGASGKEGGAGGAGSASSINGSSITRAGGGGGSTHSTGSAVANGGAGGGGNGQFAGTAGTSGSLNTGGGGGGAGESVAGGAGGSGIVIISYSDSNGNVVVPVGLFYKANGTGIKTNGTGVAVTPTLTTGGKKIYEFLEGSGNIQIT